MTENELMDSKNRADYFRANLEVVPVNLLDKFFSQNVCIPKGDITHLEWVYKRMTDVYGCSENLDYMLKFASILGIKPSEPIYEWQWLAQEINTKKVFITLYTKNENPEFINSVPLYRIEETKRIRQ